ncbi:uncharacterized protein LOC114533778 [Dendronephthya gigantea]|uniref:uncharacterized protein LOC114533778 n=1 Tax=Dendronephthya gigantea TaxID=151771 RepID=UPI00106AB382|nr:uncharacterized protein LOC114533778 [Dendronephthya gigantea]
MLKQLFLFFVVSSFFSTPEAKVEEKEVITLTDVDNSAVPKKESKVEQELKDAKLEEIGFSKSYRYSKVKENGVVRRKKFIRYSKTILCVNEKAERREMEKRLPKHYISRKLNKDLDKEMKKKPVANPKQKFCDLGIEIELRPNGRKRFFFFCIHVHFLW